MAAKIIFVFSEGRTGSTMLCKLFLNYQHVINFNEALFESGNDFFYSDINFGRFLFKKYNMFFLKELKIKLFNDPIQLLSTIADYYTDDTIILKIHLHQLDTLTEKNLDWILSQPNHRFILLQRANFLETYVSEFIATQSNIWHNDNTANTKIKIDIPHYIMQINLQKQWQNKIKHDLNDHNIDTLMVEYNKDLKYYDNNDFINLVDPWIKRVVLDLQLGKPPIMSSKRQNTNENIFDNITNHEEIKELIKKDKYIM